MMSRREFILAGCAAAASCGVAGAQQAPLVGWLSTSSPTLLDPRSMDAFRLGLRENGLEEGHNVTLDIRWAEGKPDLMGKYAQELVARKPAVIVTAGPQPIRALMAATKTVPIVVAITSDPVADGFVDNLAHPGGNVTGLSMSNPELESKRAAILYEAVPSLRRLLIVHDPSMGTLLQEAEKAALALKLEPVPVAFRADDPGAVERAFERAAKGSGTGVQVMASPFINFNRSRVYALVDRHRTPAVWEADNFVREGGFLSYGPNFPEMYRQSATYVAQILRGAHPGDLPMQRPARFELAVNLRTAAALEITLLATLLARADVVIE